MSALRINENNFASVREGNRPVLLDFYANWCGPCRLVAPVIEEVATERPDVTVGKINVDESPALAREFRIYSIPTLVVLRDGKVVAQASGARPKAEILALLDR